MNEYTYRAHDDEVSGAAWSPDGKRLASSGLDGTVQVWNVAHPEARRLLTYTGHTTQGGYDLVTAVGWSPDGRWIASGDANGIIQVWDAATGERRATYYGHAHVPVQMLAWAPDSERIASGDELGRAHVWDVAAQELLAAYTGHRYLLDALAWSPDGTRLATASTFPEPFDQSAPPPTDVLEPLAPIGGPIPPFLDLSSPEAAAPDISWPIPFFPETSEPDADANAEGEPPWYGVPVPPWLPEESASEIDTIESAALVGLAPPCTLHIWDAATGQAIGIYHGKPDGAIATVSWSPDGKHIATGGRTLDVWDAGQGEIIFTYEGHSGPIVRVAWSPDGRRIASASHDRTIQVWTPFVAEQRPLIYEGRDWRVGGLAWSPDGARLAFGDKDGSVHLWEVE